MLRPGFPKVGMLEPAAGIEQHHDFLVVSPALPAEVMESGQGAAPSEQVNIPSVRHRSRTACISSFSDWKPISLPRDLAWTRGLQPLPRVSA
jgi:hypothetical protein